MYIFNPFYLKDYSYFKKGIICKERNGETKKFNQIWKQNYQLFKRILTFIKIN